MKIYNSYFDHDCGLAEILLNRINPLNLFLEADIFETELHKEGKYYKPHIKEAKIHHAHLSHEIYWNTEDLKYKSKILSLISIDQYKKMFIEILKNKISIDEEIEILKIINEQISLDHCWNIIGEQDENCNFVKDIFGEYVYNYEPAIDKALSTLYGHGLNCYAILMNNDRFNQFINNGINEKFLHTFPTNSYKYIHPSTPSAIYKNNKVYVSCLCPKNAVYLLGHPLSKEKQRNDLFSDFGEKVGNIYTTEFIVTDDVNNNTTKVEKDIFIHIPYGFYMARIKFK